jgi:hypothetical protein
MQFFYFHPQLGLEFIKNFFGAMDITFSSNVRQMTDWLAQGKFAICLGCKDSQRAKNHGLPVDEFDTSSWTEGGAGLSTAGQIALQTLEGCQGKEVTIYVLDAGPGTSGYHQHPGESFTYVLEGTQTRKARGEATTTLTSGALSTTAPCRSTGPKTLLA